MAKICYLDCFAGLSTEKMIGAFLDAGVDLKQLNNSISTLPLNISFEAKSVCCNGLNVTAVVVNDTDNKIIDDPLAVLANSALSDHIKNEAIQALSILLEASKKRYKQYNISAATLSKLVAVITCIDILAIDKIICSSIPRPQSPSATVASPADPIVYELLMGIPCYGVAQQEELVSPLAIAIVKTVIDEFGLMPLFRQDYIGYGAQCLEKEGVANYLRIILGETENTFEKSSQQEVQEIEVISTNLDDWSPETHPYLTDKLLNSGALDVAITPICMKKGRPGFCLQVLANPAKSDILKDIILSETTAIGLRFHLENRRTLKRKKVSLASPWGEIEAKEVETPSGTVIYPEYEACRMIAEKNNITIQTVYRFVQGTNNE